jgi:hypothetical protein
MVRVSEPIYPSTWYYHSDLCARLLKVGQADRDLIAVPGIDLMIEETLLLNRNSLMHGQLSRGTKRHLLGKLGLLGAVVIGCIRQKHAP